MNAEQAVKLAESNPALDLQAILFGHRDCLVHGVVSSKAAEALDAAGMSFGYLGRHEGKIVCVPNGND